MATCGDVPERRGFLAIPRAERSDKACSRTFRHPPAAETFVNKSFRSTLEGSHAVQLTFGDCVQGGDCQLTVPSFRECLSGSGNEKAPPKDRLIPGPGCRLQPFEGLLKRVVDEVGVDLGGREVPVPERTLHDQDVACPTVEVGGEGVARHCQLTARTTNRCKTIAGLSGYRDRFPSCKRTRPQHSVVSRFQFVPPHSEEIEDNSVNRKESLSLRRRLERPHLPLPLPGRLV